ncbi:MAG TPA: aldehyde dehydrogenase family protein [Ilumatobacter sp.]
MTVTSETHPGSPEHDRQVRLSAQVELVRSGFRNGVVAPVEARIAQLEQLRRFLVEHEPAITAALHSDLGKSAIEAYLTEVVTTTNEIGHALAHIRSWTAPRKVSLPMHQRPGTGRIVPEPLGTVLIITPWNYPLHLALAPLVPILAAGNTAVLKPSEIAPATSELLAARLGEYLDPAAVQVVTGGVDEATALLAEPFDHIFYTGNGTTAKVVMRAAAEHLTPVTLELGGKSPAIVTASADIAVSARRIAWGKWLNVGQTCIAPDYVLVDERVADEFVAAVGAAVNEFYGADVAASPDYGRIVSTRHFDRLTALLDGGGYDSVAIGGTPDRDARYFPPTVLTGVDAAAAVMSEEIFGPILPVLTTRQLDDAIEFVNGRAKPLATYVFAADAAEADRVVAETSSGAVVVNHTLLHFGVPGFPFGGVGASGMGRYHGQFGFDTFSHGKPVLRRGTKPDPKLGYPPYTSFKQKLLRKLL